VLLYELLTGTTPFDRRSGSSRPGSTSAADHPRGGAAAAEHPAEHPGELAATVASPTAGIEPRKLSAAGPRRAGLDRDEGLEKDRNRRYETANAFAADVQRYLADEPVQACPPSAGYRLRQVLQVFSDHPGGGQECGIPPGRPIRSGGLRGRHRQGLGPWHGQP
jgi:eukaryotic-like serine/threonine-protein kinase